MKSLDIEIAIADYFNPRRNLIVPNVYWGIWDARHGALHECDLLILTPAGYATEVEIKTSISDLKADKKKRHGHGHRLIRRLYFALPEKIIKVKTITQDIFSPQQPKEDLVEHIPTRAGILAITPDGYVKNLREAQINHYAITFTEEQKKKLYHLAAMRIWKLKKSLSKKGNGKQ